MNRNAFTHVAPDEAQGHARSPEFSNEKVASGFAWGIRQVANRGVYEVPGIEGNPIVHESSGWGEGFQKP